MDALSTEAGLVAALSDYLSRQVNRRVALEGVKRISTGWESDVYAFDAPEWQSGGRVLRLYFGARARETARHEFRALAMLARAGYPVPQVDLVEPDNAPLGRSFLIMQRVEGVSLGRRLHNADPAVRANELDRFCRLLARLHTLSWQTLPGAEHVPAVTVEQQLDFWESFGAQHPIDALTRGLGWLRAAAPKIAAQPLGLVHWDFHHENILVDGADQAWVIDWTQFQASDVRFDLAWTLVLLASERDPATADAVRTGYYAQRGWDADAVAEEMGFFEAAACAKRLLSVIISLGMGADAVGMRPGAEQIMISRLSRFVPVYRRWVDLTGTPLPDVEAMLADHL